jgi:molybdate transport system substrate-binding protein
VAAELQVIAGAGIAAPLKEIVAQFEKKTGHKLVIRYGTTPELIKMATGGPFDLAVVPVDVYKNDTARATFAAGAPIEVARVGIGVAVRCGGTEARHQHARGAEEDAAQRQVDRLDPGERDWLPLAGIYERLGITDAMKTKIKPAPNPTQMVQSVANGDCELGVFLTNVLTAPGIDLVGPFPPEVQMEVVYQTAVSAGTKQAAAAKAFIAYLRGPAAAATIRSKGMTRSP